MKHMYIHIPFCESICSYCDFCKMYYQKEWIMPYLKRLEEEISSYSVSEVMDTIYIGGGTPSCLAYDELEFLFSMLKPYVGEQTEFTIECNIESICRDKIALFLKYGINRVSIGVQSFLDKNLVYLNRHHNKDMVFEKVRLLKQSGISNINIDIIYALPVENLEDVIQDITLFLELDIPHLSTYSLMIEPHTLLSIQGEVCIEDDLDSMMYFAIKEKLADYHHYEVSNFSKPGFESRHNLGYWNNDNYYGFGLGASGYVLNVRYQNTESIQKYLNGVCRVNEEVLSWNEIVENAFILGLRKVDGISISEFVEKYGISILDLEIVQELLGEEKLVQNGDFIRVSDDYLYLSNDILIRFMGFDYEEVRSVC